jgi:hypothetical protein
MVVGEIAAGVTSLKATFELAQAMIGVRDAAAFQAKRAEMIGLINDALSKSIASQEAHLELLDEKRALEAEVARLTAWNAEKKNYELKTIGRGTVAFMLKPDARGTEPPHWVCPTCFEQSKKAFLQPTGVQVGRAFLFRCQNCRQEVAANFQAEWS